MDNLYNFITKHTVSTFSTYRGIRIKLKLCEEVVRITYDPRGDYEETVDDFCEIFQNNDCCDCCCIGVSNFEELKEYVIYHRQENTEEHNDEHTKEHTIAINEVINDFGWNKDEVIATGTEYEEYVFKNKIIYDEILKDIEDMKKYCKNNNFTPCWR